MDISIWEEEVSVLPKKTFTCIELFAGAGGLAIGLEKAKLKSILLNELDKDACKTLRLNRPNWEVVNDDIKNIDFKKYQDQVDVISGGFPCQAFSTVGKRLGLEDTRGTLFYEFARSVKEAKPKIFLAENVKGLLVHEQGKTLEVIMGVFKDLGYKVETRLLNAVDYKVPQKRERLFFIGIREDLYKQGIFQWPSPYGKQLTLKDALKSGILYKEDVPKSIGQKYAQKKKEIMELVPAGGYWRDLPKNLQKEYLGGTYFTEGGKTGIACRLSWDNPCFTLLCSPAQKQTERCHPDETRPLTTREYARIQTFPDEWNFHGSMVSIYRQIGNAVPVNLGWALGCSIVRTLNMI